MANTNGSNAGSGASFTAASAAAACAGTGAGGRIRSSAGALSRRVGSARSSNQDGAARPSAASDGAIANAASRPSSPPIRSADTTIVTGRPSLPTAPASSIARADTVSAANSTPATSPSSSTPLPRRSSPSARYTDRAVLASDKPANVPPSAPFLMAALDGGAHPPGRETRNDPSCTGNSPVPLALGEQAHDNVHRCATHTRAAWRERRVGTGQGEVSGPSWGPASLAATLGWSI